MRIGISTFHAAHNYGAVLQAYALSRYLSETYKAKVQFVNYLPNSAKDAYRMLPKVNNMKSFKAFIWALLQYQNNYKRHKGFKAFAANEFELSQVYSCEKELLENPPDVNVLITGSDQVFRYKNTDSDPFFLSYAKPLGIRSIAYAPSFGVAKLNPMFHNKVSQLLNQIDFLSCRETSGSGIIKDLTGRDAPVVVDPVFLLNREEWLRISPKSLYIDEPYILCYALVGLESQLAIARSIANETGIKIVVLSGKKAKDKSITSITTASPYEFISLFSNASYVVTDSFHGTAFSILFRNPFISYIAIPEASSRIINLLDRIGMSGHLYQNGISSAKSMLQESRDFTICSIESEISESKKILDLAIRGLSRG